MVSGEPGLAKYRVLLHETADAVAADDAILFDCDAEDNAHAIEQAKDAYPQGSVVRAGTYEEFGARVIYNAAEMDLCDGAGFWNNDIGWVSLDQATVFSANETDLSLPNATYGCQPQWVEWKVARAIMAEFVLKSALTADLIAYDEEELRDLIEDMRVSHPWHTNPDKAIEATRVLEGLRAEMGSRQELHANGVER